MGFIHTFTRPTFAKGPHHGDARIVTSDDLAQAHYSLLAHKSEKYPRSLNHHTPVTFDRMCQPAIARTAASSEYRGKLSPPILSLRMSHL
jgi:hypothetical protein